MSSPNPQGSPNNDKDPWEWDNNKYSVDKVYAGSKGVSGPKKTARGINMPESLLGQISIFIQSGLVPEIRTLEDFIRDATIHRTHYWGEHKKDPNLLANASLHSKMFRIHQAAAQERDFQGYIVDLESAIKRAEPYPEEFNEVMRDAKEVQIGLQSRRQKEQLQGVLVRYTK